MTSQLGKAHDIAKSQPPTRASPKYPFRSPSSPAKLQTYKLVMGGGGIFWCFLRIFSIFWCWDRDFWSSQVQAQLKAATLANEPRPRSAFQLLLIRFRAGFEASRIKCGSKPDRKRLKIRSGCPLILQGRLLWVEDTWLDANILTLEEFECRGGNLGLLGCLAWAACIGKQLAHTG